MSVELSAAGKHPHNVPEMHDMVTTEAIHALNRFQDVVDKGRYAAFDLTRHEEPAGLQVRLSHLNATLRDVTNPSTSEVSIAQLSELTEEAKPKLVAFAVRRNFTHKESTTAADRAASLLLKDIIKGPLRFVSVDQESVMQRLLARTFMYEAGIMKPTPGHDIIQLLTPSSKPLPTAASTREPYTIFMRELRQYFHLFSADERAALVLKSCFDLPPVAISQVIGWPVHMTEHMLANVINVAKRKHNNRTY